LRAQADAPETQRRPLQYLSQRGSKPESREAALNRLLRDYPTSSEAAQARQNLVHNLRGEEKVKALRKLIESESDRGAAMELRRQLLYALGEVENTQGVVDEYEKMAADAGELGAKDYGSRRAVAQAGWPAASAYYRLGQYEKSVELYELLRRPKHIINACALVKLGRFREAIEACEGSDSRSAELVRAFAWHGMGQEEKAAVAFERLAFDKLDPQAAAPGLWQARQPP